MMSIQVPIKHLQENVGVNGWWLKNPLTDGKE